MDQPLKLITIDGPSASGKSSIARILAKKLNWLWVSTGVFYRGLALLCLEQSIFNGQRSLKALEELINNPFWKVEMKKEGTQIYINGKNRTGDIFSEKIALLASDLSQIPEVRQALLKLQRDCFVPQRGLVAEGRDCGTVVFPRARVKIYLTADEKTRAIRRYGQQDDNGIHGLRQDKKEEYRSDSGAEAASLQPGKGENNLKKILENQTLRDKQDVMRKTAPLMIPQGAFVIDSTSLNENQVVKQILDYV